VKLSILMPVYNESNYVARAVKRVLDVDHPCEIELVVVDDASSDGTAEVLAGLAELTDSPIRVITHPRNRGKGAAVRTAADAATGDYMVILDTDLEYDPRDIPTLLEPVVDGRAEVVYGNRTFGAHSAYSFWYVMGNKGLTTVANALFNSYISDLETCLKLMPVELFRSLEIRSPRFGMEAEITGKLLRRGIRPYEVPVCYVARMREDGKKITWRDGVAALFILVRERARPVAPRQGRPAAGS
jgi:glycosyltransferase involved in cell wall biosynthesis